jgi:hypothetical protein
MPRLHLFEFEDQPWFPPLVRGCMTDFLAFMGGLSYAALPYREFAARLAAAMQATGDDTLVDLCSGSGGPALTIARLVGEELGRPPRVVLTDLFPNLERLRRLRDGAPGKVDFSSEPVNAVSVPESLAGFRLVCNGFHHLQPEQARACLRDAVEKRRGIAVAELVDRSATSLLSIALGVSAELLVTPWIRPVRASRLLLTYIVPVVPVCTLWDGLVSCLRAYDPSELRELVAGLPESDYEWEIGRLRVPGLPANVTYLIGRPGPA